MSYVIYNKETTRLFSIPARSVGCWKDTWANKGAVTRAFNKAVADGKISKETHDISDKVFFHNEIEKTEIVKNILTGAEVEQRVNTPRCCDPSSELYHCM